MSEINRSEFSLTDRQKQMLDHVSQEILSRRLAIKYSLGLHVVTVERSKLFDPLEDDPDLKLRASVLASGIRETYFGIRVDEPLDGDTSVPTYYSIVQVDRVTGVSINGLSLCVGNALGNKLTIEPNMIGFFDPTDLWTIRKLSEHQLAVGFNPR